jgi:hypothetical protein
VPSCWLGADGPLLVATTVERAAIFARVAIVPGTRLARMALARLDRHKPSAAVGKSLEPDSIRCQNATEHDSESDESLLHIDSQCFSSNLRHRMTQAMQKGGELPVKLRAQIDSGRLAFNHGYAFIRPRSAGV